MGFYDLNKAQRLQLVDEINVAIRADIHQTTSDHIIAYFSDEDTYIRKIAYQAVGKIAAGCPDLQPKILTLLDELLTFNNEKVRQTVINAAGEIGMKEFGNVEHFFDHALFDEHHAVRNAVIGSVKKMGEKNPEPVLQWARKHLHHPDQEVRREICHGIELRGRTHPQDILPVLKELQFDKTARVKSTLVHVLGQIAYKKNCLGMVVEHLKTWDNQAIVRQALDEIIDVHHRYKDFSVLNQEQAIAYIDKHYWQEIQREPLA
ncbi:HEAT repeat domain-containing protein [Parapedobacter pyrenivorans]|uniref:HEAT repeat domain-containing protein n=1 Tax=Parapedobacter pyrenivorans TaxID=1305674 RepID=UPI003341554F